MFDARQFAAAGSFLTAHRFHTARHFLAAALLLAAPLSPSFAADDRGSRSISQTPSTDASDIVIQGPTAPPPTTPFVATPQAPQSTFTGPTTPLDSASSEDIRDIRGPRVFWPFWLLPALIAGALALVAAVYAFWRWRRRQRPERPLLPFEIALQRLEQIRALMQPSTVREFSIAITDTIRQYIEQRFHVTAAHRTTEEFLRDLLNTREQSLAVHRGLLSRFLEQCDLAKFAGMSLTQANMESLYDSAHSFVVETARPPPTPEEPRAALSPT